MPTFIWEGRTRQGEVRAGTMDAANADLVIERLRQQQIQASKVKRKPVEIHLKIGTGIKKKEIVVFTRQFATMIDAGLPLVQCLEILGSQQANFHFRKVISSVKAEVEAGSTLADALGKHPKVFDDLYVNLVAAGEVGGILDTILNRLATYMEKSLKLLAKVKGALVYPAVVITVAAVVTVILLVFVIVVEVVVVLFFVVAVGLFFVVEQFVVFVVVLIAVEDLVVELFFVFDGDKAPV